MILVLVLVSALVHCFFQVRKLVVKFCVSCAALITVELPKNDRM